ncbi:MAG: PAS domain S-box protein, partial [Planctomycetes bacterium]|nr:PAS domain S-box protein [Planctomycetota bacterium]
MDDSRRTKAQLVEELSRLRREAEEALRESRAEFQAIYDRMGDGILVADAETRRFVRANPAICRMLGYTRDELLALSVDGIHPAEYLPHVLEQFAAVASGRLPVAADVPCLRKDGAVFYADVAAIPAPFEGQAWAIGIFRDVTERRATDEALRRSEEQYRLLFEQSVDGIVVVGADGRIASANAAMWRILGRPQDEVVGSDVLCHIYPEDIHLVRKRYDLLMSGAAPLPGQAYRLVRPDGSPIWVEMRSRPLQWEGRPGFLVVARDITDRRQAEDALRASEARYRAVVEDQTEMITRFTPDGTVTFVNEAICRLFGKTRDELLGHVFTPHVHPDDVALVAEAICSLTPERPVKTHENRDVLSSGEVRWVQWTNHGVFDEAGRLAEIQAVGRDVTERRAAEEALRQSEEKYRALFEQSLDGVAVVADGRVVSANPAFVAIYQRRIEDVPGMDPVADMHPDDRQRAAARMREILSGRPGPAHSRRYRLVRPDGSVAVIEALARRIEWEGRPAVQGILRDVTERVRLEEELAEALKMEAVGQLAGGIAHDFNNLMTGILCHAGLLKDNPQPPDDVREAAGLIEGAARRAADLTSQLLGFARRGKHRDVPVDVHAAVETTIRLLGRSLDPRIGVAARFQGDPVFVRGDPVQVEQVVLNLALNARDAMPEGGQMTFATEVCRLDEAACAGRPQARPGEYVVLTVEDTGCGIAPDGLGRIFEPFFTTKPQGRGTGMG